MLSLPRHWYPRLMVAIWCGHIPVVTWLSPDSLSHRAIAASGPMAQAFLLVLALTAAVAVLDVVVNDLLPPRWHLPVTHRRHLGYMGMALALLMLAGIVGTRHGLSAILLSYILPACFATGVTWLDIFSRHQRRCTAPAA